jgi:hypothetical protein
MIKFATILQKRSNNMISRLIFTIATTALLGACNQVTLNAEKVEQININNPDNVAIKKQPTSSTKIAKNPTSSFDYLSKLNLSTGPCPDRDPATYGVLLKSRTKISNDNIVCYYN